MLRHCGRCSKTHFLKFKHTLSLTQMLRWCGFAKLLMKLLAMLDLVTPSSCRLLGTEQAGSTYTYSSKALHPVWGFLAGWCMIIDYILIPLLSVIFASLTAAKLAPQIPYYVWATIAAAGITLINLRGIEMTARANYLMNLIMGASLVWFIAVAVWALLHGVGEGALFSRKPFYNPETFSFRAIVEASSLAVLSFIGFDGITTLSEDAKNPKRDILRATVLVCLIAGGIFVLQSYLAQMVWPNYSTFSPVETAFIDIGKLIGGETLYYFLSFVLLVAGIASAVNGQASASRLLYGMGRDRLLPHRIFAYVHPKLGTPIYSVLLMGGISLIGAMFLKYVEAAELINFGALVGFMSVNLAVISHYLLGERRRGGTTLLINLAAPGLGFLVCFYIWLHLSFFALKLGAVWLALGFVYLLFLTRGFRKSLVDLKI
jgi:putrescine importer